MRFDDIEKQVRELHKVVWENRELFLPNGCRDVVDLLAPPFGAAILGARYEELEEITDCFSDPGVSTRISGLIDRQTNKIVVATNSSPTEARYTGAHELGHWKLHPNMKLHRDRPEIMSTENRRPRAPLEREADFFAACYLMPRRLVTSRFKSTFGQVPLRIDDSLAYYLDPTDPQSLLYCDEGNPVRELAVARINQINGRHFVSLADQFKVSVSAMAYRLKELNLLLWP